MFRPSVCRVVIGKDRTFCRFPRKNPYGARRNGLSFYAGTEGSNLLSSSEESCANRLGRWPRFFAAMSWPLP